MWLDGVGYMRADGLNSPWQCPLMSPGRAPNAFHLRSITILFYSTDRISNQHVRIFAVILYLQILLTRGLLFLCCRDRCSLCKCCSGLVNRWWLMFMSAQWRMFFNPLKSLKRQMSHRSLWLKWILISIMNAFFWPFLFQEVLLMDTTVKVLWLFSPVFRFHIKYVLNGK